MRPVLLIGSLAALLAPAAHAQDYARYMPAENYQHFAAPATVTAYYPQSYPSYVPVAQPAYYGVVQHAPYYNPSVSQYGVQNNQNYSQTIHHCGRLPAQRATYTRSADNVLTVQDKLANLGYKIRSDGVYGPRSRATVRRFQSDYGLRTDGVVGAETASNLAYYSHSGRNVQRCDYANQTRYW